MKKFIGTTIIILAITFAVNAQQKNFIDQPYIEVNGTADSLITPNEIFIQIIISEKDSKDRIPVEASEEKMIAALNALGIKTQTDLVTSDMISNYRSYLLKKKDVLKSKQYTLKVANAQTASKVFIQLEDLGISNVSIERVDHTDLEKIENNCRTQAVINAHEKALAMTRPLGQSIGNALLISDNNVSLNAALHGRVAGIAIRGVSSLDNVSKYQAPKIDFEKIKVTSTVSVTFLLK